MTTKRRGSRQELERHPVEPTFSIPRRYWAWSLEDLPMSVRLANILKNAGCRLLADLREISLASLMLLPTCGRRSVSELERLIDRIVSGGFERVSGPLNGQGCVALIDFIDDAIGELDPKRRNILLLRLGGVGKKPLTLEEIGMEYGSTRENTRLILDRLFEEMRRLGGPPLRRMLRVIADTCLQNVSPLTPDLLQHWTGERASAFLFGVEFYVRLLGELETRIPVWPEGQPATSPIGRRQLGRARGRLIRSRIAEVLRGSSVRPLREIFETLEAMPDLEGLTAEEFLDAVKRSPFARVEMTSTGDSLVSGGKLRTRRWVYEVLSLSDRPLTPDELLGRGRDLYGEGFNSATLAGFHRLIHDVPGSQEPQFFLLGPTRIGLVKHIKLPLRLWPQVKSDCYRLLAREKRPFSTGEIIRDNYFGWAALTNEYELAAILRADDRFVRFRRMAVGLKEWHIQRAVPLLEVVEEVLAAAGRPLPAYKIRDEVRRRRPVRRDASLSPLLLTHPRLSYHGQGYYGLKSLDKRARQTLVADAMYVNRVIAHSTEPLTFEQLCRAVGVPSTGPLAAALWKTVQSLSKVTIEQGATGSDAVIYHRYWGNRKAERERARRIRALKKLRRADATSRSY